MPMISFEVRKPLTRVNFTILHNPKSNPNCDYKIAVYFRDSEEPTFLCRNELFWQILKSLERL